MSNIPKLRFPEFKGEWEEKKIIQFCEISAGGDIDKNNSQKEFSSSYPYSVYSNSLENKGLYGYANYYKIDSDVVTVTGRGDVGHAVARHEKFVPIVRLLVCKPKNNENVDFLENAINKTKIFIESTGVPQLTAPQLGNVKLFLPSLAEQQKIADLLSNVDSIITAETKILNILQKKKKALMQKLFTRQLRFKSANGTDFPAWEEKKLGDVCSYIGGGTPSKKVKEYWDGNINWASVKDITGKYLYETQDKISELGADSSATNICEPDSLLLITRMSPGKTVITKCITAINQDLKIVKSDINVEFLHLLFQSIQTKIDEKTSGTTVKGISIEGLNQIDIRLPCKAEQKKSPTVFQTWIH